MHHEIHTIGARSAAGTGWIMVIGPDSKRPPAMVDALRGLGFALAIADDFHEAKRVLAAQTPDLLVAHVRLGEYNGLQLVLRGRMTAPHMAAILVADAPDPVLERDLSRMNASLVLSTAGRDEWIAAALRAIPHAGQPVS
jgi:DNA-binding NtrC family response regulator